MLHYSLLILNWFLDIIFPKKCLGCSNFTKKNDFDYVCSKCFSEVEIKNTLECIGCKRQTKFGLTCTRCIAENNIKTDQLIIATELNDPLVEKILKAYKYKFISDMALPLNGLLIKSVKRLHSKGFELFNDSPLPVPIPLCKRRFNWRGFNQAELLAKKLSDNFLLSYNGSVLKRVSNHKHQAEIASKEKRINNVKDDFALVNAESIRGRAVILVDDICTTGATLNECAGVLKRGGARRVVGLVVSRGKFKANF